MDLGLKGKVAVITGGSDGIGRATAEVLAREGAKVVICARGQEKLDQTAAQIKKEGGEVMAVQADVTSDADIAKSPARRLNSLKPNFVSAASSGNRTSASSSSSSTSRPRSRSASAATARACTPPPGATSPTRGRRTFFQPEHPAERAGPRRPEAGPRGATGSG